MISVVHPSSSIPTFPISTKIIHPTKGVVWYKGEDRFANVTWDATNIPEDYADLSFGTVVKLRNDQGKVMDLAKNFRIADGYVVFPLPESTFECSHCVVSVCDTKNASPEFEIRDE